jgi:hypothetical protein
MCEQELTANSESNSAHFAGYSYCLIMSNIGILVENFLIFFIKKLP